MKNYYDVTAPIRKGMAVYKGDPEVYIDPFSSIKGGDPCNLLNISIGSHTGTHIDAPFHFFQNGKTLDDIPLDVLMGPARLISLQGHKCITKKVLQNVDIDDCERVLIKTDQSLLWDRFTRFRTDYVYLDVEACGYLIQKGVKLVGIDSFSIEKFDSPDSMCHKVLLGAGILIVELLDLKDVEPGDYHMYCLPLKIYKADGAPVRVVLTPVKAG